jgi:hypothetical protein
MRTLALSILFIAVLGTAVLGIAESRHWQDATVVKLTSDQSGSETVIVPVGGGVYGATAPTTHQFYWIKTEKITYVIHNYSNGAFVERWLVLTIGGPTKIAVDRKDIHILDDEGKDRKCRVVMKIANHA